MNERATKRLGPVLWLASRTRRFWIAVALLLPVLYVGSFGPACWVTARWGFVRAHSLIPIRPDPPPQWMVIYWPIGAFLDKSESYTSAVLKWWVVLFVDGDHVARVPINASSTDWFTHSRHRFPFFYAF
ncbi:MAG: hypothetical protein ACKV0T_04805 [Planctomycetales bacterium]